MYKYRLLIAYDGTTYSGWQIQPNALSIQQKISETALIIVKEPIILIGSGRTDAGVHAMGQVAHFTTEKPLEMARFIYSMNSLLPKDIRILEGHQVDNDFHARYSAIKKEYHYHLSLNNIVNPFQRLYTVAAHHPLNRDAIEKAAKYFIGTHDFTTFANSRSQGAVAHNPVRTIYRLDVIDAEGGLRLEFEGNGFLYKMVRNIVGTLLDVSKGKLSAEAIPDLFASKNRLCAGRAAPPQGLFLMKVTYPSQEEGHQSSLDRGPPAQEKLEFLDNE